MTLPDTTGASKPLSRPERSGAPSLPTEASVDFALALLKDKQFARARMLLEERCRRESADAQCWFLLGAACDGAGDCAAALAAFDRALACEPGYAQALNARATLLAANGRLAEALESFRAALAVVPSDPQTLVNIGVALEQLNDTASALTHYDRALAIDGTHLAALLNRGALLARSGRHHEALANNRRLAGHYPRVADAHFNCADVLLALMRYAEALEACDHALALDAAHASAHFDRAIALAALGRLAEAHAALARARALDQQIERHMARGASLDGVLVEDALDLRLVYLHAGLCRIEVCDWGGRDAFVADFARLIAESAAAPLRDRSLIRPALFLPLAPERQLALARGVSRHVARCAGTPLAAATGRQAERRPRIGYLSPDFAEHLNARQTRPIYEYHDRDRFEVYCYALTPGDGSELRAAIVRSADCFRDLSHLDDEQAARRIAADGIDILIDLSGYCRGSRTEILALRPAPVQAGYLEFSGSTGAAFIDYRITDRVATPQDQLRWWTEQPVFLPHTFFIYDDRLEHAAAGASRAAYGLPQQAFLFCCFNAAAKIEPTGFAIWMRLLARVPGSVLWLLARDPAIADNLRREAVRHGIAAERLIFARPEPLPAHLARCRLADLFLDTLQFNAMATGCDALWAGLPLLTCAGASFASRTAASLLQAAGLPELVAADADDYEKRALHFVLDRDALRQIRNRLVRNRRTMPLFDTRARVRELEAAYCLVWDRHCSGLPPQPLEVPPQDESGGGVASQ
jgi:predicted O-linked N-acetylglucosamine transferase (SPINDLY family)